MTILGFAVIYCLVIVSGGSSVILGNLNLQNSEINQLFVLKFYDPITLTLPIQIEITDLQEAQVQFTAQRCNFSENFVIIFSISGTI